MSSLAAPALPALRVAPSARRRRDRGVRVAVASSSPSSSPAPAPARHLNHPTPPDDASRLLPPTPQRVADVSRTLSIPLPNIRPLKDTPSSFLLAAKIGSAVMLTTCVGGLVAHDVALAARRATGEDEDGDGAPSRDVSDLDWELGYSHNYGKGYGYAYGYAYGHAFGDDELTTRRPRLKRLPTRAKASDADDAAAKKEPWSESANPAKRALGKIGSALWGLWDAIPA